MIVENIVFFGTSAFAVPILEALGQSEWRPGVVITAPDQPAGRGLKPKASPVKQRALALGLEVWEPERIKDQTWAERVALEKPGLIILAAYGAIIPQTILGIPRFGSLNVHPSLLPRWRGPAPIQYAILEGDAETGATIFVMDEKMDHGPIIAQESVAIEPDDTAETLEQKLSALGAALLLQTLPRWLAGKIAAQPQDHTQATFSKFFTKEDGLIDWSLPAEVIDRRVRAFSPWPGSYTFWRQNGASVRLKITRTLPHPARHATPAGVVFGTEGKLFVAAGKGSLEILALQPEGKKTMRGTQFLTGHRDIIGASLQTLDKKSPTW